MLCIQCGVNIAIPCSHIMANRLHVNYEIDSWMMNVLVATANLQLHLWMEIYCHEGKERSINNGERRLLQLQPLEHSYKPNEDGSDATITAVIIAGRCAAPKADQVSVVLDRTDDIYMSCMQYLWIHLPRQSASFPPSLIRILNLISSYVIFWQGHWAYLRGLYRGALFGASWVPWIRMRWKSSILLSAAVRRTQFLPHIHRTIKCTHNLTLAVWYSTKSN